MTKYQAGFATAVWSTPLVLGIFALFLFGHIINYNITCLINVRHVALVLKRDMNMDKNLKLDG